MEVYTFSPFGFEAVSYLVHESGKAILVDAGVTPDRVKKVLDERYLTLSAIVLTHGHFDHILYADELREFFGVPLYVHTNDAEMLTDSDKNAFSAFFGKARTWRSADKLLKNGDEITVGEGSLTVLHTPGHTKGSICLEGDGILLSGDTLFAESFGRYDLYGGDAGSLRRSLLRLSSLPSETMIYPGHGASARLSDAMDAILPFIG